MDWSYFIYFAAPALFCWIGGAWLAYRPSFSKGAVAWTVFGLAILAHPINQGENSLIL